MRKSFIQLTLASNGKGTIVPKDNIAFVIDMEGENERRVMAAFSRIFLKQADTGDDAKWVDVKEPVAEIMKKVTN